MDRANLPKQMLGTSLIEVLVTIIILALGLLGLAGLQSRLQVAQIESYQRAQALILLNDMASRIAANGIDADNYVTTSPLGAGMTCPTSTSTRQQADSSEWCNALQGAGETTGGNRVGVMVGGRGCIDKPGAATEYLITVAWQGMAPVAAPPSPGGTVPCNSALGGLYNNGTTCTDDHCRREVTTLVRIPTL